LSPPYPKRLIEVDLPIKRISAHARREKSIRHGHISTLHIWWARRPLAAHRGAELQRMQRNFYGFDPSYHVARHHFVHRKPHAWTPRHLARHR